MEFRVSLAVILVPLRSCWPFDWGAVPLHQMALKLGRLFNVSPELWFGIQADYDLEIARERSEAAIIRRIQPLKLSPAA